MINLSLFLATAASFAKYLLEVWVLTAAHTPGVTMKELKVSLTLA